VTDGFRKFDFDREFAPDGRILREGDTFKRVYTEEEMQMVAEQAAEAARQVAEIEAQEAAAEAAAQNPRCMPRCGLPRKSNRNSIVANDDNYALAA
jgi:phosphoribulokinase